MQKEAKYRGSLSDNDILILDPYNSWVPGFYMDGTC